MHIRRAGVIGDAATEDRYVTRWYSAFRKNKTLGNEEEAWITRDYPSVSPTEFAHKRQRFFERFHRTSPEPERWHAASRNFIHTTTRNWFNEARMSNGIKILNAGSGGADYGISEPMVHVDLFTPPKVIRGEYIQADIEDIPLPDLSFDFVFCVGSVINYCDPIRCLGEFARLSRRGAFLILEYERSASAEFIRQRGFGSAAARFETFFGNTTTHIWAYSDRFVNAALANAGFRMKRSRHFHCASAIALAIVGRPDKVASLISWDHVCSRVPGMKTLASNRILLAEKIATNRDHKLNRL